jgi:hypothetical protein
MRSVVLIWHKDQGERRGVFPNYALGIDMMVRTAGWAGPQEAVRIAIIRGKLSKGESRGPAQRRRMTEKD